MNEGARTDLLIKTNEGFRGRDLRQAYDLIADSYDAAFRTPQALAENEVIFKMIREYGKGYVDRGRVLDLGCGTGLFLEYIQKGMYDYCGIDTSQRMLEVARKKFPLTDFINADMACIPQINDNSISMAVSLFGSFSYTLEPGRVAAELMRVLQPGGKFFIMAYSQRYISRKSYIMKRMNTYSIKYKSCSLKRIFKRFSDVKVQGFHALAEPIYDKIDTLPILDRIGEDELAWYLKAEAETLGRIWPDSCYFLIVTGSKPIDAAAEIMADMFGGVD